MDKNETVVCPMKIKDIFEIEGEKFKVEYHVVLQGPKYIMDSSLDHDFNKIRYLLQHSHFRMFRECLDTMKEDGEKDNQTKDRVRKSIEKLIESKKEKGPYLINLKKLRSVIRTILTSDCCYEVTRAYYYLYVELNISKEEFSTIYIEGLEKTYYSLKDFSYPIENFTGTLIEKIIGGIEFILQQERLDKNR
jgi:hypothetical protein